MANHKSAIKRARISLRRAAINSKTISEVRTVETKLRKALASKDKASAEKLLVSYMSCVGKAAQKGRVHTSTASRKIGRIARQIAQLGK